MRAELYCGNASLTPLLAKPELNASRDDELLFGHFFRWESQVETNAGLFAQGYIENFDGTVGNRGYIHRPHRVLQRRNDKATHRVSALGAPLFLRPDLKAPIGPILPYDSRIVAVETKGGFIRSAQGWLDNRHLSKVNQPVDDWVAEAQRFIGLPYIWGGRSSRGLDCSGLVKTVLSAAGIAAPRDSGPQSKTLGQALPLQPRPKLRRGDLIFWIGHVGIMQDTDRLLHANAHHMMTAIEPLAEAEARIKKSAGAVIAIRRL